MRWVHPLTDAHAVTGGYLLEGQSKSRFAPVSAKGGRSEPLAALVSTKLLDLSEAKTLNFCTIIRKPLNAIGAIRTHAA